MVQYYTLKILEATLAYLPKRLCYLLASILGVLTFGAVSSLRRIVTANISHVLAPQEYNGKLNKTVRGVLTSTFKNYLDLVKIPRLARKGMMDMMNVTGIHNLEKAVSKGNGVILCTAHLGSFDTAFQVFSKYSTRLTVVVEPIEPPILLNYVTGIRKRLGINILPAVSGALKQIFKILRNGEMVLFVLDRDTAGARVQSHFFGKVTSMPAEAVKIAIRTGAAIVPVFNSRRPDGGYDVFIEPELDIIRNGNNSLAQNMERVARVMEKYIRRFPEQWVVLEPVWNS